MEQFFTFLINNWVLSLIWIVLFVLLLRDNSIKSGQKLSTGEATSMYNKGDATFLDIREKGEFDKGHIANSVNIAQSALKTRISELNSKKDDPIIIVCKTGQTASIAGKTLIEEGFSKVYRLNGGIMEWTNSNLPLVTTK